MSPHFPFPSNGMTTAKIVKRKKSLCLFGYENRRNAWKNLIREKTGFYVCLATELSKTVGFKQMISRKKVSKCIVPPLPQKIISKHATACKHAADFSLGVYHLHKSKHDDYSSQKTSANSLLSERKKLSVTNCTEESR